MGNKKIKILTLCLIHEHPRILLGMKKRGFGAGRWNGFGGKLMEGESIEEAARREVREEAGLEVKDLERRGIIQFEFLNDPTCLEVHIFKVGSFSGQPIETDEMKPEWFTVDQIPFSQMWSDDPYWFPLFLQGKKFRGRFKFDKPSTAEENSRILDREIGEVSDFGHAD